MRVAKINAYIDVFKNHLKITQSYNELYKYECLKNFKTHWDLGALDLHTMFDKSFTSQISGRLWGGSTNSAKEMMLKFIELDKEFVRSMFRNLFSNDKDVNMRFNRFRFHCDQLLQQIQHTDKKQSGHYHTDQEISVYLSFNSPELYTLFDYAPFQIMMIRLEIKTVPQEFELDRYQKLAKGLYTMLSKDAELLALHQKHKAEDMYEQEHNMLIVHDFLKVCCGVKPLNV